MRFANNSILFLCIFCTASKHFWNLDCSQKWNSDIFHNLNNNQHKIKRHYKKSKKNRYILLIKYKQKALLVYITFITNCLMKMSRNALRERISFWLGRSPSWGIKKKIIHFKHTFLRNTCSFNLPCQKRMVLNIRSQPLQRFEYKYKCTTTNATHIRLVSIHSTSLQVKNDHKYFNSLFWGTKA